jgi:predicted amidohydrolase YtcJ
VINASGHLAYANSALMAARGVTASTTDRGVLFDDGGEPLGEFHETAMGLLFAAEDFVGVDSADAVWKGGWLAQIAGCTTMTDLSTVTMGAAFDALVGAATDEAYPVRVVYAPSMATLTSTFPDGAAIAAHLDDVATRGTDRFVMGPLKWIADGSIQGYTGKLRWPGYCGGVDHGFLILDEEQLVAQIQPLHDRGYQAAIHTNGDEATEVTLRALERVVTATPRPDHRHRLEHCQLASRDQFRRMAAMGVGVNLFSNHVFYWGDIHRTSTVGPDKARRMNAAATADREGVHFSLHSDAPVTPVGPLFTMWCAVNRVTRSGFVLGEHERISAAQALEAMTLGAAYLLKMDHVIGSIEVGKYADLTVLDADPLEVQPMAIKDISVLGTVLGGTVVERHAR